MWKIQQNYFATKGIEAWKDEVPFYISSNAFIGQRYALLVTNFIRDYQRLHPQNRHPFYIIEIGSGTGMFSFHFLRALEELLKTYKLEDQKFCYIMTDVTEENIIFCKNNVSFAPFIERGELDFACFNVSEDKDLNLNILGKKFSELNSQTPAIVIANYTFDCIKQDIFSYVNGKFYEIKLGLRSRYKDFDVNKARYLGDLRLQFEENEVDASHFYENSRLNEILLEYKEYFKEKSAKILMPLGALQFFDNMIALNPKGFLMIVGDKGVALPDKIPLYSKNQLASFDGCYSFTVNFHAMGTYLKKLNGDYLPTQKASDFKVNLYSMGMKFEDLTETKGCFTALLESTGPDEYSAIFGEYLTNSYRFSLRGILSFLKLSEWDPDAYSVIHDRLIELLPTANPQFQDEIERDLSLVKDRIYRIHIGDDVYNLLGIYYQRKGLDEKALEMYQLSIDVFPKKAASHNNAAIIYEKQKNYPKAITHYEKSYNLDKNNKFAKRKALILSGKPVYAYVMPFLKGLFVVGAIAALIYLVRK